MAMNEGNVYLNGQPICSDGWDVNEANLVCKALGYERGVPDVAGTYGPVTGYHTMNWVECGESDTNIWECKFDRETECDKDAAAAVICSNKDVSDWNNVFYFIVFSIALCFILMIVMIFVVKRKGKATKMQNVLDISAYKSTGGTTTSGEAELGIRM